MKVQKNKLIVIAGPCVIEDKKSAFEVAGYLKKVMSRYPVNFIFKASFDKANRTSLGSYRGPGIKEGLKILGAIKEKLNIPILSDVHWPQQVEEVKDILDVIQIPAFLSRQTDLIIAAAKTKKTINVKKAQFMSPYDIKFVIEKITSTGNKKIFVTERGSCFGYNNLIVDFRSLLIMKGFGYPVIFDATHSLQRPSSDKGISGGDREYIEPLSLAGLCCGADGLFLEVHPEPQRARSDKATSLALKKIENLIKKVLKIRGVVNEKAQK